MSIALQKNRTDCMPTCLSELLNIPYEEIPVFIDLEDISNGAAFDVKLDTWLDSIGYYRMTIPTSYDAEKHEIKLPYNSLNGYRCIGILSQKQKPFDHAIILNVDKVDDEITLDDPLGDKSDYTIADIIEIEFILKKECL